MKKLPIYLLSLFFLTLTISMVKAQCIDNANNLSWPCAWNPAECTECCTSSANGTCDFYFHCGTSQNGSECVIYIVCSSPSSQNKIPVEISTCDFDEVWTVEVPNNPAGYALINEQDIFQDNSPSCNEWGGSINLRFEINGNESAAYNFNCL